MKTYLSKTFFFLTLLMTATVMHAHTGLPEADLPIVEVGKVSAEKKMAVRVSRVNQLTHLQIRSEEAGVVYQQRLPEGDTFLKLYDLASLEAGRYELVIKTPQRELIQPFTVQEYGLGLNPADKYEYFMPQVSITADKQLDFSLLNPAGGPVEVALIAPSGETIYESRFNDQRTISRRFDLGRARAGEYSLRITSAGRTTYRQFSVR